MRELLLAILLAPRFAAQDLQLADVRVGHWVEVKGDLEPDGAFLASALEIQAPQERHVLIGIARTVDGGARRFQLLGKSVEAPADVRWDEGLALGELEGRRVKVEGHWAGAERFIAREIGPRGEGRDRISGRVDVLELTTAGFEARVAGQRVRFAADASIECAVPVASIALAPAAAQLEASPMWQRSVLDEDYVPGTISLAEHLTLGGILEVKTTREENNDLDETEADDVHSTRYSVRPQLLWTPSRGFAALISPQIEWTRRDDEEEPEDTWESDVRLKEGWVSWRGLGGGAFDVQVGRQDFDDPREWIYKKNLDAVRAVWRGFGLRIEASGSTLFGEESDEFDREATNWFLQVSNDDPDRLIGAWLFDRRAGGELDSYPIHFGARVLGEWIPDVELWGEASLLRGYEHDLNLSGWAFDVGATWQPSFAGRFYVSAGYAFGSGDDAGTATRDESFRQTGLQRNNGKLGGVTSFRYYGEVFDPELSNLAVATLGIGTRITDDASIDLVWHDYHQDVAAAFLRDSDLDQDPDGVHRHLGREIDLVLGWRNWHKSQFELVAGRFEPGDAFADADDAWRFSFQWRFSF